MTAPETLATRFRELIEQRRPPTGGVPLTSVVAQAAPVLALLVELPRGHSAEAQDFDGFEFRECLTVLTLLGRRLALLDLTPSAAVCVVQAALHAAVEARSEDSWAFANCATAAAVEGFVLGREERVAELHGQRAAACLRPLPIAERAWALIPSGEHEPETLSACVDALGRAMLDTNALVALVDLSQLGRPERDTAIAIFAADETARMLGASCIFAGVDDRWQTAAEDAHIDLGSLLVTESLAEGIHMLSRLAGAREQRAGAWRAVVDRLRGQRPETP